MREEQTYIHPNLLLLVPSGVPQGSHLGPILFLAFINDLPDIFDFGKPLLFADDLKIYQIIETIEDWRKMQCDLDKLKTWCANNRLPLNPSKCKHIKVSKKRNCIQSNYILDGKELDEVDEIKDLGVIFDKKMTFIPHYNDIVKKANKALGFVWRNSHKFKIPNSRLILFKSLVRSHLEYCPSIWYPHYDCHVNRLERIQKRFISYMTKSIKLENELPHYKDKLVYFKLKTLASRRRDADLVFLYKLLNSETNTPDILELVKFNIPRSGYRSGKFKLFHVKLHRTELGKNSPITRMSNLANELWQERGIDMFEKSLRAFKTKIKETQG